MRWVLAALLLGGCTAGATAKCARQPHIPRVVTTYGPELARPRYEDRSREKRLVNIAYGRMYRQSMPLLDAGGGEGAVRCGN